MKWELHKKNPTKHWTDTTLRTVIAEQREAGTSIRKLSKKYGIPKTTLHKHLSGGANETVGRTRVFNDNQEKDLQQCIVDMVDLGFALKEFVESFVFYNDLDKAKVI